MYEPGEVKIAWRAPSPDFEDVADPGVLAYDYGDGTEYPVAYLPHSCDEWVIGGPAAVRALIADLEAALTRMEGR